VKRAFRKKKNKATATATIKIKKNNIRRRLMMKQLTLMNQDIFKSNSTNSSGRSSGHVSSNSSSSGSISGSRTPACAIIDTPTKMTTMRKKEIVFNYFIANKVF
jgi:hypothetical protein